MTLLVPLLLALSGLQTPLSDVDVLSYDLQISIQPAQRAIVGRARIEVFARGGSLRGLEFALNKAFEIDSVRDAKRKLIPRAGADAGPGRRWFVPLVPALRKGQRRTIFFEYHGLGEDPGESQRDWPGILLVREDELRMGHESLWYPALALDDEARSVLFAPTKLELELPVGLHSQGPGELLGTELRGETELHRWESARPVRPSLAAGRYVLQVIDVGQESVRLLSREEHRAGAMQWGRVAASVIETLRELYGDPGPQSWGLVEMRVANRAQFYHYAVDGFSLYDGAFLNGRGPDEHQIAREVARMFFGCGVDPRREAAPFLRESLAEAAALVYLEHSSGPNLARDAAQELSDAYFEAPGAESSVATSEPGDARHGPVIQSRGVLILRSLRASSGPEEFDGALREFLAGCAVESSRANLGALLSELRKALGPALDTWELDWLRRTATPRYRLEFASEPAGGQRVMIRGTLRQMGELFHNPLELRLVSKTGRSVTIQVTPMARSLTFQAVAPHDVERIEIDPRRLLLAQPGEVRRLDS